MKVMDANVLGRLVDEHAAALVLYARQWCAMPEDVVLEAFIKLAAQRSGRDNPLAWLYRVVRNGAISAARADQRRRRHESTAAARVCAWFVPSEETALDGATATAALQGLPVDQREVLVAHLWGRLTFDQIGVLTGTSASSAHRRYLSGLSALRERLRVPCPEGPTKRTN
jgi:RNA polymerase sigma-70 factor (ECF subfamily)